MKQIKNTLLLFLWFALASSILRAEGLDKRFQILPLPQKVELLKGTGPAGIELTYITLHGEGEIPVLGTLLNALPRSQRQGKGITLSLLRQEEAGKELPESPEGYILEVTSKGVTIRSRGQAGLFYGCQTLEQLMEDSRDHRIRIPCLRITDYPEISYRAVHFDTKHHLDRTEYYYRTIDKLARYKVNAVIWEVEDKLRENPHSDWEFCPSDARTYEVQFDLYRDALEAMPDGKYLHIGGDEITAIGIDERCKATGKSAFELQMFWLKMVSQKRARRNGSYGCRYR